MTGKTSLERSTRPKAAARDADERVTSSSPPPPPSSQFPVVGIGASAGGLEAFTQLLQALPATTGMAFVLIQHLDPARGSLLKEALARSTEMAVSEVEDGTLVEPDHVYVIPPAADLGFHDGRLRLVPRAKEGRGVAHLPVDAFLRALAEERGSHAIGAVLSGTASDGTEGLRAIKAADGITFAQDPSSAKFPGMPRSALEAGVVDYCLPLPGIAEELARLSRHPYVCAGPTSPLAADEKTFRAILAAVRGRVGLDLSEYKRPTIERRLARRMALRRIDDLERYLEILQAEPAEVIALYEDVLIHVTSFFRDPEVFEVLKTQIFPEIIRHKAEGAPIRIWVAGCSTGEEVYGLAIALLEVLGGSTRPIQIFGSDVSAQAIDKARAGVYPDSALREVSDDRRRRYFVKSDQGNRIVKSVRDLCVFVQHDLGSDPPFSKLDLVSCRNVLIYFDSELQERVLSRLHYSLNQPGYLLLGRSESITGFGTLFTPEDRKHKIFARSVLPSRLRFARPAPSSGHAAAERHAPHADRRAGDLGHQVDRVLLSRYAPPGVLIDEKLDILQFRGATGAYLQPPSGAPQHNLLKMARRGLIAALRTTLAQARKQGLPARSQSVAIEGDDGTERRVDVVVVPVAGVSDAAAPVYLVLFEEPGRAAPRRPRSSRAPGSDAARVTKLEQELAATREYLHSLVEEQDRANDDLGSANEELVSGNEELQSMNEELETAKEELQSTNEELTTVNDELNSRNLELAQLNSDLVNVLGTVEIPILILDMERRIRRYTPDARRILSIRASDVGRPLDDIKLHVVVRDLDQQIAEVIETMLVKEFEVKDEQGHWYRMQIRPYRTSDNRIDGAILSLVDIDALKHHITDAQQARREAELANQTKDQFLATLSHELRTPLASMLMHAQLLRRGGMDDVKLRRVGEAIERGTRMQVQLIEDLLDVSRIAAGKLKLETKVVALDEVIHAAVDGVRPLSERRGIELVTVLPDAPLGPVAGDPTRLQQVVTNLLTNAIKFSSQGGRVTVTLEQAGASARIKVSDTGVGIEPRFLPHVFNRFAQEDSSTTRTHGGLGLGLAIVRHLVELHGGTVLAESPGKGLGATLSVTLPLLMVVHDGGAHPAALAGDASTGRAADDRLRDLGVLVVDDDGPTREALADVLGLHGARVVTAGSAAEAMTAIDSFGPAVLICDLAMPGEDGCAFVQRLRARGDETPAVALTALAGEADRLRARAAGFQRFLSKPVELETLLRAVAELGGREAPAAAPSSTAGGADS